MLEKVRKGKPQIQKSTDLEEDTGKLAAKDYTSLSELTEKFSRGSEDSDMRTGKIQSQKLKEGTDFCTIS